MGPVELSQACDRAANARTRAIVAYLRAVWAHAVADVIERDFLGKETAPALQLPPRDRLPRDQGDVAEWVAEHGWSAP